MPVTTRELFEKAGRGNLACCLELPLLLLTEGFRTPWCQMPSKLAFSQSTHVNYSSTLFGLSVFWWLPSNARQLSSRHFCVQMLYQDSKDEGTSFHPVLQSYILSPIGKHAAIQTKLCYLDYEGLKDVAASPKLAWSHTESWQGEKLLSGLPPPAQSGKPAGDLKAGGHF